jgi:hypothetical protein
VIAPETIQRVRQGAPTDETDVQGHPILGFATSTNILIKAFSPAGSNDSEADFGNVSISGGTVYGYRGTDIRDSDLLVIRGVAYHVDGEIGDWKSPYAGAPDGIQFAVKRAS